MRQLMIPAMLAVMLGAPAQAQTSAPVTDPAEFAVMAASGNTFEIESSRLLLTQRPDGPTAAFAQQMIAEHGAAGEKMLAAAAKDGVAVPQAMTAADQAQYDRLRQTDPTMLEQAYVAAQTAAHDKAVLLFSSFADEGEPSQLRTFATETLPTLKHHRMEIDALPQPAGG